MEKRKIIGLLGFLFLLLALPLALLVMRQQVEYRGRASNPPSIPTDIRITNLHDKGFTVSWVTNQDTTGSIKFGTNDSPSIVVNDIRGAANLSKTHYVDVFDGMTGVTINANTPYTFKIQSGDAPNNEFGKQPTDTGPYSYASGVAGGAVFTITSAPTISYTETNIDNASNTPGAYSLEPQAFATCNQNTTPPKATCYRPNPVWGQVLNSSNQPVEGAIVYMNLSGTNHTLSALAQGTTYAGKWVMDLANFRTSALNLYTSYTPFNIPATKSTLTFTVQGGANGTKNLPGVEIPEVINIPASGTGSDCATVPANCLAPLLPTTGWTGTVDTDKYIQIVLSPLSGPTNTPVPTSTVGPTNTPVPTATVGPTNTPVPTATVGPTNTPVPTSTVGPTNTPVPTATVGPTNTPAPTATPGGATPTPTTEVSIPGDADSNGDVDITDYGTWALNYTGTITPTPNAPRGPSIGDFNNDASVDITDYGIWALNYTGTRK